MDGQRCSAGRSGSWSTRPSGRSMQHAGVDRRRHRARRPPPGQHPHHRRGQRNASASRWSAPSIILDRTGNTSAASIPLALADAVDAGRLHAGDLVLLVGFGAGMTWASAVDAVGHGVSEPAASPAPSSSPAGRRGIGLACARAFAADGAPRRGHCTATSRSTSLALAVQCDVTDADAGRRRVRHRRGGARPGRGRSWPTPASPATGCSCACARTTSSDVLDTNLTGALPRRQAGHRADDAGPLGPASSSCRRSAPTSARRARPTTPPSKAGLIGLARVHRPRVRDPRASPPTSWRRARSPPT